MRTLYVRKRGPVWELSADDLALSVYSTEHDAAEAALGMVHRWPERYSVCIIDDERDASKQHQGKRTDQVEYSAVIAWVGLCVGAVFLLFILIKAILSDWGQ